MFGRLLLLFTIVPLLELVILIQLGQRIGVLNTILVVIVTAVVGTSLARSQGLQVVSRMRHNLAQGIVPAQELLEGAMILSAGLLLITPGLLTDLTGLLLLIPPVRRAAIGWLKRGIRTWIGLGGPRSWRWR